MKIAFQNVVPDAMAGDLQVAATVTDALLKENRRLDGQFRRYQSEIIALQRELDEYRQAERPADAHRRRRCKATRGMRLTHMQSIILEYIARGLSSQQIAATINVTGRTVRNHTSSLYRKLGVNTRTQAALYAWRNGVISIDEAWESVKTLQSGQLP